MADADHTVLMGMGERPLTADPEAFLKAPKAKLVCLDDSLLEGQKGLVILLDGTEKILGRDETNSAPLHYAKVSRKHARIYPADGRWGIEDLNSTNGVFVNDARLPPSSPASLKSGDYVRIGAIPFRFVLERPDDLSMSQESAGGGEDDSGKTMMFGALSGNAAGILLAAEEEAEAESATKPAAKPVAAAQPVFTSAGQYQAQGAKGSSQTGKWIGIAAAVLLVAGGAFYFVTAKSGGKEEAVTIQRQLKDYQAGHEDPNAPVADDAATIQAIQDQASQAVAAYPANPQLKELLAQTLLFHLEKQLASNIKDGKAPMALQAVEATRTVMTPLKDPKAKGNVDDLLKLIDLAKEVAGIKAFRQVYPNPSKEAKAPAANEMSAYQESRGRFMELKRDSKTDELLKTQFLILNKLVTDMDREDLPYLDQWKNILK